MKRMVYLALALMVTLVACGTKTEPVVETKAPPPPPEPTTEEITRDMKAALDPLKPYLMMPVEVPVGVKEQALAGLRSAQQKYNGKVNLPSAKKNMVGELTNIARQLEQSEFWRGVVVTCDAIETIEVGNSGAKRMREHANEELSRPKLGKPSYIVDEQNGVTTVFIEVTFPDVNRKETFKVREGDDFADGRFQLKRVIGRNQGIVVLDKKDSKELEIYSRPPNGGAAPKSSAG